MSNALTLIMLLWLTGGLIRRRLSKRGLSLQARYLMLRLRLLGSGVRVPIGRWGRA